MTVTRELWDTVRGVQLLLEHREGILQMRAENYNDSKQWLGPHYVPGTALGTLHELSHLILTVLLSKYCYYLRSICETSWGPERLSDSTEVTQPYSEESGFELRQSDPSQTWSLIKCPPIPESLTGSCGLWYDSPNRKSSFPTPSRMTQKYPKERCPYRVI